MKITTFLDENYSEAALYLLYRATASYIDGLKNAARKAVYTIKKDNVRAPIKVTSFGGKITDKAGYLHGEMGIQGTIVTMSKNYCGANNLPVLKGVGSFGTRHSNAASAPRYIFAAPADYFDLIFRKEDDVNLLAQKFEGDDIEPVFYVPTLPMLLVNGSEGIGVGFASDIYPRSVENMIKLCRAAIEKKSIKKEWFNPSWHGYEGTVELVEENSWIVKGVATINGKKVSITEVPMTWDLQSYLQHLRTLKDEGKIQRFNDFSEDDKFTFEVLLTEAEAAEPETTIWKDLGLVVSMKENLTAMDENNSVRDSYKDARDIFNDYFAVKIKFLKLRIKSETVRLTEEEQALKETYKYIQEVIKGTITIKDKKKAELEADLKKKGYTIIEKLISMPMYSITVDKAKEIEKKWKDKIKELEAMKKATPESIWLQDLDELEAELLKEHIIEIPEKKTTKKKETKNGKK